MKVDEFATHLRGVLAFVPTPFAADGTVDRKHLVRQITRLADDGSVSAVVVAGGVGEYYALDIDDYRDLIEAALEAAAGLPVIVGTASSTRASTAVAAAARDLGAAGLMVNPLAFVASTPEQLLRHYGAVFEASGLGMIAFSTSAQRLDLHTLHHLCEAVPGVVAFKDEVGDLGAFLSVRRELGSRLMLVNGMAEPLARVYAAAGADAMTSGIANALPRLVVALWSAATSGDRRRVEEIETALTPLLELRSRVPGHQTAVLKAAIADAVDPDFPVEVRLPLRPLRSDERTELTAALDVARREQDRGSA